MVKIYKGVVVYQNIGNVVIPDAQVDDLKVNNIATINTLDVLDTLGLSNIKINSGTITKYPVNQFDIVNKKYVDDNEGAFDPTQHIILTGTPDSLTVKKKAYFNGEVDFDGDINIDTDKIKYDSNSDKLYFKPINASFKNSNDITMGNLLNNDTSLILNVINNGSAINTRKIELISGIGSTLDAQDYNKGIEIGNSGLTIKGNTTFDNDITAGTGTNQIKLDTVNGDISGKTLTLSEGIQSGTIKVGSSSNQITLDSQTGGITGKLITLSGNLTAGAGTNQITLNSSLGKISCKDAYLTDNINMTGNTGYKLTQNGTFNASFSQDPSNSLVNLKSSKFVNFHIFRGLGDTYDADNINKGLCISSTGIAFKGDTTFNNNVSVSGNLTSSGNLTINGTSNNTINGFSIFKSGLRVDNSVVSVLATEINDGFSVSYDSKSLYIYPEHITGDDDGYRIFTPYTNLSLHLYAGGSHYSSANAKGLRISNTNGVEVKGDTTFNNNVSLTTGTISTAPTNNNDIANKLYVDTVATSGFDPTSTMTLTNTNSLITNGDITNKTLIKTIEGEGTFSSSIETVEFIMNYISSQPAGFFYDPKHNKIMTIKISNNEANIYMYDLSTNSSSLVRITDGTYTFMTVKSFQGRYDYINDTISIMICGLTNEGSPRTNRYTFYDYDNNSFSEFVEVKYTYTSHVLVSPQCTGSYDSKYYYFYSTEEAGTIMGLILESNLKFYFLSTSICAENIKNVYSFDYVDNNRFILVSTDTKLYLYKHSATSTSPSFSLCDSYTFVNDSNSKFFINGENNKSCYIYSSKFIYRCEIINSSNGYTIDVDVYYDNSSSNNSYSSGIVNYDGSLYMLSKYTTDNTITIDQFMRCGIQLKLIASKTYSDMDKSSPNYCILVKNQLYFITYKGSGQMPFYLRKISKLNNSSIISSNQTSINGNIKFDEEINIDDYPKDINEVITYGKLLKILKTCFTGNTDLSNLFVNYNKYISSCK